MVGLARSLVHGTILHQRLHHHQRGAIILTRKLTMTSHAQADWNKTITTEGSGPTPQKGQKVTVHYTGTLESGSKFDSSRDRGQPFVFTIGVGQVIKAWDEGVATMKVGERAMLKAQPSAGYGARGFPPVIPPNSVLNFDVELISVS